MVLLADRPSKVAVHVYSPALAAEIWDICTMLVLVPSVNHIWVKVIPGGGVHRHWKEPSLATVQERLAVDTTVSGPGGSREGGCKNVMGSMGRETETGYRICHRMISLTREMLTAFYHTQATFGLYMSWE